MRINKYIASCGICSRRKAEEIIKSGKVFVNGVIVTELHYDIQAEDVVYLDGKLISVEEEKKYIVLNKPKNIISAVSDNRGRKTVIDIINLDEKYRIFPVGRLDYDTEGLILLTNDGDFANKAIHPKYNKYKTYEVIIDKYIDDENIKKISKKIIIDNYEIKNSIIKRDAFNKNKYIVKIKEGRNRQIKKMFQSMNAKVIYLKRLAIGNLELRDLKVGEFRYLTEDEINYFF